MKNQRVQFLIVFCLYSSVLISQNQDSIIHAPCYKKQVVTLGATGAVYSGGMFLLHQLWYKDYPRSSFHFFNDNREWLQMDKAGHVYSAYHLSELAYRAARYSCLPEKQSTWGSTGFAMLFLTTVEIFDGFSTEWGASTGDIIANTTGTALFAGQQLLWKEQKFRLKFSYYPGKYAKYRPNVLGNSPITRILKDYNAQTYWLSFSPGTFFKKGTMTWPDWLCLSLGYSGDGMLGGHENPTEINGQVLPEFNRQRQFYFSLDLNLSEIQTQSKVMKTLFSAFNTIKIPFPAVSFQTNDQFNFHLIHF